MVQGNPDISRDLTITNTGADGSTLSVDCSKSNDAGNVFTITNGTGDIASGASAAVTVSCDASSPVDTHTATMSCAHNGDGTGESSPAVYNLSCTVNAAPAPLYSSVPAAGTPVNMSATFENDPITPVDLTITNVGDDGTTLTGSCSFSGSAKISLTPGGAFSLPKGSSSVQTLSCDSSEEGVYNGTLSCTHDGPASSSPATHAVECTVGPPPPPQFSSNPAAGSSPSISPPDGTPQNESPAPTSALVFSNTAPAGSDDLEISCSNTGGTGAAISVDLNSFLIPAGGSATATFTCATDTVGQNTYEYSCDYGRPSSTPIGTAVYTYTCEVRDPVSVVEPDPVSGTTLTQEVGEGETGVFQVVFNELKNEGEPGELTSCQLTDGTNFAITDPTVYPAAIPAGGSVTVTVEGTAPDGEAMANDTLECTYRDSSSGEVGPTASYPLELVVSTGTLARILVTKTFSDGITDEVTMTLSCNGGFTNADSVQVAGGDPSGFTFVITTFEDGALDCTVTESGGPSGYSSNMPNGCSFTDMSTDASPYACAFVNTATNGTFTVSKVWEDLGGPDSEIELVTTLQVDCTRDIVSATPSCTSGDANTCVWENVVGDVNGVLTIDNSQGSASCTVSEPIVGEGVEASGCETAVTVSAGSNVGCTITNTVFFEGIPTLSQYGLAIMALLMLGIGLVGFRRFA